VARLLAQNPSNTVILVGGILSQDRPSGTGLLGEQVVWDLHVQKAFVSASGFSIECVLTEVHLEDAQLKRKAIELADQVFALVEFRGIARKHRAGRGWTGYLRITGGFPWPKDIISPWTLMIPLDRIDGMERMRNC
jgi:hypothetical protein